MNYARHKDAARTRQADLSRLGRDIGPIPPVANPARRERGRRSLRIFGEVYFPTKFNLEWSPDHLTVIASMETAILDGGLFAMAMPRGSGKTTLCEVATLWALLIGAHAFVLLLGNAKPHAAAMLGNLKTELSTNELLFADWPEVCYPIRRLNGEARLCIGQLHHGRPTWIGWGPDYITLPTIPGSRASGAMVKTAGLTSTFRGANYTRKYDRASLRPSLVICDDPQTDQSARSPSQCARREAIINGAVLGLAGPGKKPAVILPCTVVQADDLADRLLDRDKNPVWQGIRTKMVYAWPTAETLWDEYARLRADSFRAGGNGKPATAYYAAHRAEMDAGARVAWPARYARDELSAIQHAVNLRLRDQVAFEAEYQNEPPKPDAGDAPSFPPDLVSGRLNGLARATLADRAQYLTWFADLHDSAIFWMAVAWAQDFTGWIVDYNVWPEQHGQAFTLRSITRTLGRKYPKRDKDQAIYAGLMDLSTETLARDWPREDGDPLRAGRGLVDAGYVPEVAKQFCRMSESAAILMPSRGQGIGPAEKPITEYDRKRGDLIGENWWIPGASSRRKGGRHVRYDTNAWKSWIAGRFALEPTQRGSLSLWGKSAGQHRLLAEHLDAEFATRTLGRGRTVDVWKLKPGRDNHWLDCLVGCAVGASMLGIRQPIAVTAEGISQAPPPPKRRRPRVSYMK